MTDILTYNGYRARVGFDAGERIFLGRIAGIQDGVGFHADTVNGQVSAFEEAVDDYLKTCARIGKKPDRPYSGKVMLRVSPELHAQLAMRAQLIGRSLNQIGEDALRKAVG